MLRYELLQHCEPVPIPNGLTITGINWSSNDPRDAAGPITVSNSTAHELYAKCLAIQKVVAGNPPDPKHYGGIPGASITFELTFQISDYKTIGNIVVTDYLSDGHKYVQNSATLTVTDRLSPPVTGSFTIGTNLFETQADTSFMPVPLVTAQSPAT